MVALRQAASVETQQPTATVDQAQNCSVAVVVVRSAAVVVVAAAVVVVPHVVLAVVPVV